MKKTELIGLIRDEYQRLFQDRHRFYNFDILYSAMCWVERDHGVRVSQEIEDYFRSKITEDGDLDYQSISDDQKKRGES